MSISKVATLGSKCPYCQSEVLFSKSSEFIYGKDYGSVYYCSNRPTCDAFVCCHNGSSKALGRLADRTLREAKKQAHHEFDTIWKEKRRRGCKGARGLGYQWLSQQLGIPSSETHIGMFDVVTCQKVIKLCQPYADRIRKKRG